MTLTRSSATFLAVWLVIGSAVSVPTLALAAAPSYQEANQAFRHGNHAAALEKVNAFLVSSPKDAQGRFLRGLILTELNRTAEAIKVFTSLTEDYPELPESYNNLAVLYAAQADYPRAKNSLEMAIRTHPSYATAHENLGDIYTKMASQAYDKALQLDKSNTSAQTKLAMIKDMFSPAPRAAKAQDNSKNKPTTKPAPATPTSTPASPPPSTPAVVASPGTPAKATTTAATTNSPDVEQAVRAWAEAWSKRDAEAYLANYSENFKVPGNRERADWAEERKFRVTRPQFIQVEIENLKIELDGDTARASFYQRYASNLLKSNSNKTLTLVRTNDRWKIVEEQ